MNQKLIMVNGAAGIGKTTISDRYANEHPLTLNLAGDQLIAMLGAWRLHESTARDYVFAYTKDLVTRHLAFGHTVIVQYLLTDASHAEAFESIAHKVKVPFYEVYLAVDRETAVERLLARGVWGEPGSPSLTEKDIPEIEALYDVMVRETTKRPRTLSLPVVVGDIEGTYLDFLALVQ